MRTFTLKSLCLFLLSEISALIVSPVARAVPVPGQQCVKNSFDKTWSDLRHQVAVMKDDQRWGLDAGGPHYGLSDAEVTYLKGLVGEVRCRSKLNGKESVATGTLIGPSKIITNAHTFLGKGLKFGVDKCVYTSRAIPPVKRTVSLGTKVTKLGTLDADVDFSNDFAIAHLDTPIDGVRPMRLREPRGFFPVESVYLISAQSIAMRRPVYTLANSCKYPSYMSYEREAEADRQQSAVRAAQVSSTEIKRRAANEEFQEKVLDNEISLRQPAAAIPFLPDCSSGVNRIA